LSLMVRLMNVIKLSILFLLMGFLLLPVLRCSGQSSGFKVMLDQYNWNSEMKILKITNQETGLILKITIWNDGSYPTDYGRLFYGQELWINVRVDSTTDSGVYFFQQLQIDNLYLPANETLTRFVNVEFVYSQPVGIYTVKVTYNFGPYSSEGQPVEGSPFDYRILDNDTFNQEIQQNKKVNVSWFSFAPSFSLFTMGDLLTFIGLPSISVVSISVYMRHKGKTKEEESKKPDEQRIKSSSR